MKISFFKTGILALMLIFPLAVRAEPQIYTGIFSNLAVGGYDTVAYFVENMPVKGKSKFSYEYKDAKWLFSNQENMDKFVASPEVFTPQYGGYCAWAVAMNDTAKGDPNYWTIENGKLYLNYDAEIKAKWIKDKSGLIKKADMNWPGVLN